MRRPNVRDCVKACLARAREISLSRLLFGDEPWLVLLAVVVGGFVFYPLLRDDWPWLLLVLSLGTAIQLWYGCCQEARAHWPGAGDREAP